jgi:hypothetical protein
MPGGAQGPPLTQVKVLVFRTREQPTGAQDPGEEQLLLHGEPLVPEIGLKPPQDFPGGQEGQQDLQTRPPVPHLHPHLAAGGEVYPAWLGILAQR